MYAAVDAYPFDFDFRASSFNLRDLEVEMWRGGGDFVAVYGDDKTVAVDLF